MTSQPPCVLVFQFKIILIKAPFTLRSIFGTARIKLVPVPLFWFLDYLFRQSKNQKSGTVPKIERSVNGA
jgi:hypothetical protein